MAAKPVYCYETKQRFGSIKEASKFIGMSESGVKTTVNNPNKTCGGYHWCTDLSVFNNAELTVGNKRPLYCYETKERFETLSSAARFSNVSPSTIHEVIDDVNGTAGGYHWCTDLSLFCEKIITSRNTQVYCHETRQWFGSLTEAAKFANVSICTISSATDSRRNLTAGGYHWCTDLSVFDGVELSYGKGVSIFCFETKQKYKSIAEAARCAGISKGVVRMSLDQPDKTAGGYHWCTDLSVFDGIELSYGHGRTIYCYETKEKFDSIICAANSKGLINSSSLSRVIDDVNGTAGGYHWCTDLSIFDGVELTYPNLGVSGKEKEVMDFVKSVYKDEIIENSRKFIYPKELDIFIPEKNLAIEFNGNYWHSEEYKSRNYHIDKTNLCKEKGIQLIHIFEHQWDNKSEIFKSVIANKLGLSQKIYARKCKIVELNSATKFLNENHLQGNCSSSIKLGLIYNGELVSAMTFGKPRFNKDYEYELLRLCNKLNTTVIGGASKLLKYFEKKYSPKSIISYANLQWSNGNVYKNLGFEHLSTSEPNYWWIKGDLVLTRYQCQKHKLKDLLGERFDLLLSEKDNMEKAGYSRLFDCGNMVFARDY